MSEITDTQPNKIKPGRKKITRFIPMLGFVALLGIGIFAGVQSGYGQRRAEQATVVSRQVDEQFLLGMEAMDNGQYEIAFQHFEFVAQHAPGYHGLQDALNQLAMWTVMSPTPLPTFTPSVTPTPDVRAAETIYEQARQYLAAGDWNNAIGSLDALRKADSGYHTVDVDGMYYIALRERGMGKLFPPSCLDINLEGGIYDLTLAERFGPLDRDAEGARNFARFYLMGAAFWKVDWEKAQYYFAQTALGYPNMMDSTCETAQERWRFATVERGKQYMGVGKYCEAQMEFDQAFTIYSEKNEPIFPTATEVFLLCNPPPPTPIPTNTAEVTPTATITITP